ncbi:hypothetical protein C2S53_002053 [Perilla frutescens var. hirtella]|uniref:F-box/LRR-repeat protein 15-like leucin rich repeat domain-containing protein n=1 Tax=Perilla frutescens var. hirtella TaxID=608512 RepID=A0AAD4P1F8_PERFH|nr:hypothetical protein C2S53_002053 [Perilla frutescens var. hirtella]
MTVLRSREILSTPNPKPSQASAPKNVVSAPVTPVKTSELLNQLSKGTASTICTPNQNIGDPEIGFDVGTGSIMVSESGSVRRLSARLAKKVDENAEVVCGKRKKVLGTSLSCVNTGNLKRQGSDMKLGVESSDGNPDIVWEVSQDFSDRGVIELVKDSEEIEDNVSAAKLGFGCDIVDNSVMETKDNVLRERRFSMEVNSLRYESSEKDRVEKGFLSLRSGKRVVKREINDNIGINGNSFQGIENSKESDAVYSGDVAVNSISEAKNEEDEKGRWKKRRCVRGDKERGKISCETLVVNGSAIGNPGSADIIGPSHDDSSHDAIEFPESSGPKEVVKDKISPVSKYDLRSSRTLSIEGKGKMKLEVETSLFSSQKKLDAGASSSSDMNSVKFTVENVNGSSVSDVDHSASDGVLMDEVQAIGTNLGVSDTRSRYMERFRNIARRNAFRFAHFSSQDDLGGRAQDVAGTEITHPESSNEIEDWPGPFSTAMKIIKDRESNRNGERHGASTDKSKAVELKWIPKSHDSCRNQKHVPLLQDICLSILSKNADAVTSLDFVPDALRHKICWFLCDSRRMDGHFLELLVHGSPTEIRIRDCSWLSEEQFVKIFDGCNTSKLTVLQFDQGGCCMPDYALYSALARSPNSLPALTAISLKAAYRLSDAGLSMLTSAAPSLKSIDISQCPLLTSEGICCLASSLRLVLRELYIDNCHGIDAMLILPALLKLENLEVLSVAGILTVCDAFVSQFTAAHGCRMKELILADCMELTDSSLEVIGDTCSDLRAIDLSNLCKLTDISIGHLANGCQAIQTLKLCRNAFSDEAIAAYLDVRGASLKSLSLNNIIQVSNHTALSLARNCKKLRTLDLSWCRNLTNEALGLVVDSCLLLEVLKLFGCTQVTNVFLDGHSNSQVKLIGLKMTPVFKHIDVPDFLLGPLRYPSACP